MHKKVTLSLCIQEASTESEAIEKFVEKVVTGDFEEDFDVKDCNCDKN